MKFEDLTKQGRLLIYMLKNEVNGHYFTLKDNADDIIRLGIAPNKNALSAMLTTLRNDVYVVHGPERSWGLSIEGERVARDLVAQVEDLDEVEWEADEPDEVEDEVEDEEPEEVEQPNTFVNDAMKQSFDAMAKAFASMAKSFEALSKIY